MLVDRSQLMMLSADPGTVVVGNPAMADVSLNGRQLFINGHSAGETNLMVFDQSGEKIADFDVTIMQVGENSMTVFTGSVLNGTSRLSYVCAPICERSMVAGDATQSFSTIVSDNQKKTDFAQGTKSASASTSAGAPVQQ
ncbi:MAG: pilus assembly protein N-terminal domain-containing protein [Aestuariivirga sp.]